MKKLPAPIIGSDIRRDATEFSKGNARAAGIGNLLEFERKELLDLRLPKGVAGTILCNPPYGERLGEEEELFPFYESIGRVFAELASGWNCCVFTGNAELGRAIKLPLKESVPLMNGTIPCRLMRFRPK